jgi:hypothetical protein
MITQTEQYLAPEDMETQETLDVQRLNNLYPKSDRYFNPAGRPPANFIDLMNWTMSLFQDALKDQTNLNKFVHNRIIVDGQFMRFCEERKISIECLHKDGVISWKTEHNFEKFFAQGVFLIKSKGIEFLHAALYHKGNQNEDEISFFIICSQANYEAYIKLRNEFDEWVTARDRGNLHIRVIEGEGLPYTKDHSWDDLFLPNDIKTEIKNLVENFLASKDFYLEKKIPWKRGVILFGHPGNGKSSLIKTIISNYNFKPVTIAPGSNDEAIRKAFAYAEDQSPSLLYFEDLDSLLERNVDPSSFLNLMDGISSKNGLLVIATANEIKKLKPNITDRPSRFDRKFEIPLPTADMAYTYLKKWFGNLISVKKCREIAKYAAKCDFAYAHLKEVYLSSMFEALSHERKIPTETDIQVAINRLVKDKNILNKGAINIDKYLKT